MKRLLMVGESRWLQWFYDLSGAADTQQFLMFLGFTVFLFVLATTLFRAATFYVLTRFTKMRIVSLATRLMEVYLSQPYQWFLTRHSSDLGKTILSEVTLVVNGPVTAAMSIYGVENLIFLIVDAPEKMFTPAMLRRTVPAPPARPTLAGPPPRTSCR